MFVAGFVGIPPMNFIEQDGVIVGFRPEALLPAEALPDKDCMRLRLLVERVEEPGVAPAGVWDHRQVKVIANHSLRLNLREGDEHEFAICSQEIRRFDPKTGVRVRP